MNSPEIAYLAASLKRLQAQVNDVSASGPGAFNAFLQTLVTKQASITVGEIPANDTVEATVSMAGAIVGRPIIVALPAAPTADAIFNAFCPSVNNVTLRVANEIVSAITLAAATYGFLQIQQ